MKKWVDHVPVQRLILTDLVYVEESRIFGKFRGGLDDESGEDRWRFFFFVRQSWVSKAADAHPMFNLQPVSSMISRNF